MFTRHKVVYCAKILAKNDYQNQHLHRFVPAYAKIKVIICKGAEKCLLNRIF